MIDKIIPDENIALTKAEGVVNTAKHLKTISIFLFGIEYGDKFPITLSFVKNEDLRNFMLEDEFGVYKKDGVKIPFNTSFQVIEK